jgi:hypothetical protein
MGLFDRLRGLLSSAGSGASTEPGEPTTGVSAFHVWWQGMSATDHYVRCAATLEVTHLPMVDKLYFWALQATFSDAKGVEYGGAHTGLQWNPHYPRNRAINWGGYDASGSVTAILKGSLSPMPSAPNDVNTRNYAWEVGVPYRFEISHTHAGWLGEVTNEVTGETAEIRTLFAGGDRLTGFVCWSEIFAGCNDPSASVKWSNLSATTAAGRVVKPTGVTLSYPTGGDCPNNDTRLDAHKAIVQTTNGTRSGHNGQLLSLR